jgi:hypothetical protein
LYPGNIYDRVDGLLGALGSFWSDTYQGRQQVRDLVEAKAIMETQTLQDFRELLEAASRYKVPILHRENWYPLWIRRSTRNNLDVSSLRYDEGAQYDAGYRYDDTPLRPLYRFPVPDELRNAGVLLNRFAAPSLVWHHGIDYTLEPGRITFVNDPFSDPRPARQPIYLDGVVVDEELLLWVWRGEFDWDTIYQQFGYVLNLRMQSSQGYRNLLNAVFDALVGGTTATQIKTAFSAITGIPLAGAHETVETVTMDSRGRLIITDQTVYRFHPDAAVLVSPGTALVPGQELTDALQFWEFKNGEVPTWLRALSLGKEHLAACFWGELVWENRDVALTVDVNHPSGFTYLSWPLGGHPLDVRKFFDEMHRRGVVEASEAIDPCAEEETITYAVECGDPPLLRRRGTLAHRLDSRHTRFGEPTAAALPRTINPLQFLVANILRNNYYVVRVRLAQRGSDALGFEHARAIQRLVPPHTAMIVLVEVSPRTDRAPSSRVEERLDFFTGMTPQYDHVERGRVFDRVRVQSLGGACR